MPSTGRLAGYRITRTTLFRQASDPLACVTVRVSTLPPMWQQRFAERFHADRIVRIDAGHQVMNTRPHALAEVLLAEAAEAAPG